MLRKSQTLVALALLGVVIATCAVFVWRPDPRRDRSAAPALEILSCKDHSYSPFVRVNVTPPASRPLRIAVDGDYEVRPAGSDRVLGRGDALAEQTVSATSRGIRIGQTEYPSARLEILASQSPAVWVGEHQYRGSLRLYRRAGGVLLAVNVLPLEDYLASVVDSEMPAAFPAEARRAQAIVARTYVLSHLQSRHPFFDVHASTQSQKYLGFQYRVGGRRLAGESGSSRRIVAETTGQACTWRGKLFCTYYSAVCGGRTTDGGSVFADAAETHHSVPCEWCRDADRYRWTIELPKSKVEQSLRNQFAAGGRRFDRLMSVSATSSGGDLPAAWEVSDGEHRYRIDRRTLSQSLPGSFPSDRFTWELAAEKAVFHGRGHGHGVGLCQWGARGMALSGRSSAQIIEHYYPGARLVVLDPPSRADPIGAGSASCQPAND